MPALAPNFEIVENADGSVVVRDVPIFAVTAKDGFNLDEAWLDRAIAYHDAAERDGQHVPPMSVGHYGETTAATAAGAISAIRKSPVRSKGGQVVPGAIANLHFTNADAVKRARNRELLWRSPEVPVKDGKPEPKFRSLALLDRPPHNELPVLTLKPAAGAAQPAWAMQSGGPVLAFASTAEAIVTLIDPETTVPAAAPKPGALRRVLDAVLGFATGDMTRVSGDALRLDSEGGDGPDSLLEKVKGLTAEALAKFNAGYVTFRAAVGAGAGSGSIESALGSPGSGGANMADDAKVVALSADVAALQLSLKNRDAKDALNAAVDAALAKCADRGVKREEIVKFAEQFPADPVKAAGVYADAMLAKVPRRDATFEDVIRGAAVDQVVPDAVLKFQNDGEKFNAAKSAWATWRKCVDAGTTSLPLDRWLDARMNTNGFARGSVSTEV